MQTAIRKNTALMLLLAGFLVLAFVAVLYGFVLRLMMRLSRQTEELSKLNKTKDRFMGMVSHDLRTPLTVTSGVASALIEEVKDEEQLALLRLVGSSSKRMLTLIDDLLDVSRIESGILELHQREVDIAGLIDDAVTDNRLIARVKDILIGEDVPAGIGAVRIDPDRLRQVLDNLLGNAVKYSPAKTTVTVGARLLPDRLELWVQDQGPGIKKSESAVIFHEFIKGGARPTAGEPSYGLGLAIAKRLVELHRGTIRIDSEPGKGTRFTISIPRSSS